MRILAIRGRNLASLAGDFSVELEEGSLGRAGLFALTGPTGAGKSTILDALCLALFDRTPRLMKVGGVPIGRPEEDEGNRLATYDVRSLLRRGAASGHAEVDFRGSDGRRYRARWAVRRARDRADGRLQAQSLELRDLDTGQALGGNKTDILPAIEERLGLSFDQFRRSALLAQGDFALFLKADERDRSELLERITGAEIYTWLSKAAYRRAQEESLAGEALARELEGLAVLESEARAALEKRSSDLAAEVEAAQARLNEARRASEWFRVLGRLRAEEEVAEGQLSDAARAWADTEESRRELAAVVEAQPLRPLVVASDAAASAAEEAAKAAVVLEAAAAGARQRLSQTEAARDATRAALARSESASAEARPALAEAARLDAQLEEAAREAEAIRRSLDTAVQAAGEARKELGGLEAAEREARASLAEAEGWLAGHQELRSLASEWGRWRKELERFSEVFRRDGALAQEEPSLLRKEEQAQGNLRAAEAELRRAELALEPARGAAAEAEAAAARIDAGEVRRERAAWEARREALLELSVLAREAGDAARDKDSADETARTARADGEDATRRAGAAGEERARLAAVLAEAEGARDRARLAQDLSGHRSALREGEPCPLCGATSHPWAAEASPLSELLAGLEGRVGELRRNLSDRDREEAASREKALQAGRIVAEAETRSEVLVRRLVQLQERWERAAAGDLPLRVLDPSALAETEARAGEAAGRLAGLREQEAEADGLTRKAIAERKGLDAAREAREEAHVSFLRAEKEAQSAGQALKEHGQALRLAEEAKCRSLADVSGAFPDWEARRERLLRDPAAFAAACEAEVEAWREHAARQVGARERLAELGSGLGGARAAVAERESERDKRAREEEERKGALAALRARRGGALGGRATREVEAELQAAADRAKRELDRRNQEVESARGEAAGSAARLEAAGKGLTEKEAAKERALLALREALAQGGLDELALRSRLGRGEAWIEAQKAGFDGLQRRMEKAAAVREERRRAREAHEAAGRPAIPEGAASETLASAETDERQAREAHYQRRAELDRDDLTRGRRAELLPRMKTGQAQADLWKALSDLIGSADGKKFRAYAQSLTLEALLSLANEHLKDLAPRYRLMRVPGHDLELQVIDLDMGEEVRSVQSLSGGESFLVSLALALGLSSLSSRRTRVESLFIDEGFGSLDPDTLDQALAVLDALQASGRKVGLISHVPGLAERIGAQVRVTPLGGGRSRVEVVGA